MTITEFIIGWVILSIVYTAGYITRKSLEDPKEPIFKRILSTDPILHGELAGRYVVEGIDGSIHYIHPPITLTLEK